MKRFFLPKRKRLILLLAVSAILSLGIFFLEWFGSKESGSLALFADAGHIFTDVFAHLVSLFALIYASKKPTFRFPFGFHRLEVLAAFFNGFLLIGISLFIFYECYLRFLGSVEVHVETMILYSLAGLFINSVSAALLFRVSKENLNLKSAYLHVLSDLLGTLAVVLGGILIHITGFQQIDNYLSIALGLFILKSSVSIVSESLKVLIEAHPQEFQTEHFLMHVEATKGVVSIPKIAVRKLTSGIYSVEVQIICTDKANRDSIIEQTHRTLKEEFGVPYVSVEVVTDSLFRSLQNITLRERDFDFAHSHHHGHHGHSHNHQQ